MSGPPKALIDELVARWKLAGLRLLIVEGVYDQRYFRLLKSEPYCGAGLRDLDVWAIDAIAVPAAVVAAHGFTGTGAKQRVVSCIRQIESRGEHAGFRGLVDRDLDLFLSRSYATAALLYTDHSCLEATLWTRETLRRLLIQYRCEAYVDTSDKLDELYKSILECCKRITAVRIVNERFPRFALSIHHSDSGLSMDGVIVQLNIDLFAEQCRPAKGCLVEVKENIIQCLVDLEEIEPLHTCNGHDLVWLLTFVLRRLTGEAARQVTQEIVAGSLISHGLSNSRIGACELIETLEVWASS